MEPVYIKQSFWRSLLFLLIIILIDYIVLYTMIGDVYIAPKWGGFFSKYILMSIVAFFASIAIPFLLFRMIKLKPIMTITIEGFIESYSIGSLIFISWDNVKNIYIEDNSKSIIDKWGNRSSIIVKIRDIKTILKEVSYFTKIALRIQTSFSPSTIEISLMASQLPSSEVLQIMQQYKAEYDRLHQANE